MRADIVVVLTPSAERLAHMGEAVPEKRKRGHPTIKTPELLEELRRRIA